MGLRGGTATRTTLDPAPAAVLPGGALALPARRDNGNENGKGDRKWERE